MAQTVYRATIQQRETLSSNLASTEDVIEHEAAKVASSSADSAPFFQSDCSLGLGPDRSECRECKASQARPTEAETGCRAAEGCSGPVDQTPHDARYSAQEPVWQEEQAGRQGDCCSDTVGSISGSGDQRRRSVHNNWSSSSCLVAPKPGVQLKQRLEARAQHIKTCRGTT